MRLAVDEPQAGQAYLRPHWDAAQRVLTFFLPKGETAVVPLSTYLSPRGLKLMGQWEWLRQYIELITVLNAQPQYLQPGAIGPARPAGRWPAFSLRGAVRQPSTTYLSTIPTLGPVQPRSSASMAVAIGRIGSASAWRWPSHRPIKRTCGLNGMPLSTC